MSFVFIVFAHYNDWAPNEYDVVYVTNSEEKKNKFMKEFDYDLPENINYVRLSYGDYDVE